MMKEYLNDRRGEASRKMLPLSARRRSVVKPKWVDRRRPLASSDLIGIAGTVTRRPCAPAKWENVGPKHISGAMRQIVIDPSNHRRLYAVSANGGIWRLDNVDKYPTNVWQPLTDDLANLRFRTMAVAPSNAGVLYAATSVKELLVDPIQVYSKIYRSGMFRGSGWQDISPSSKAVGVVHRLVVHPANVEVVFAASSTGLWRRSGENGVWTNLFADDCLEMALDPDDSSIIYLGVRAKGVFKSFTSGSDWSAVPILEYEAASAGVTDAGSTPNREAIKIALGKRNFDGSEQTSTTRTVAVRFGDEFCINHASGEGGPGAWQRSSLGDLSGASANRSDTDPIRQHEWCNCLAVDPFDPNHILAGGKRLMRSNKGGSSWVRRAHPHEDQHSVVFDDDVTRKDLVFLANDGGIFSSRNGGETWPTMSVADTKPVQGQGLNLARGLITTEFRSSVVRSGRCVAAIDHTGFILSEDLDNSRWQFLLPGPDYRGGHEHEDSVVFACPASLDRYYVIDDGDHVFQLDFTRTNGFVDEPAGGISAQPPLSDRRTFFSHYRQPLSRPDTKISYIPETNMYLNYVPGPFAVRFSAANDERLLLYGAFIGDQDHPTNFVIRALRLRTDGTHITPEANEASNPTEPYLAITFVPDDPDRAFAITERGTLLERDFSTPGQFTPVGQWHLPAGNEFVSRLIAVPRPRLRLYALSQRALARFDDGSLNAAPVTMEWATPNETLLALVAHPFLEDKLFLGTNRGVYLSEDGGTSFEPYRLGMPQVPVTELTFDGVYLYAATFGRGLWRCIPCPLNNTLTVTWT